MTLSFNTLKPNYTSLWLLYQFENNFLLKYALNNASQCSGVVYIIPAIRIFRFLRVEPWDKVVPSAVGARNIMANREIKYISMYLYL